MPSYLISLFSHGLDINSVLAANRTSGVIKQNKNIGNQLELSVLNDFNNSLTFFQIDMKVWGTIAFYFNNHSDICPHQKTTLTMHISHKSFYMKQSMPLVNFFIQFIYLKKVVLFKTLSIFAITSKLYVSYSGILPSCSPSGNAYASCNTLFNYLISYVGLTSCPR